jgi:UrcA family protein
MNYLAISAVALSLAAPVFGHASALSNQQPASVRLRYHAESLETSKAAADMLRRIDGAALEACGASDFSLKMYRDTVQASACYRKGVSQAVAELNVPTVTQLYNGQAETGSPGRRE